MTFVVCISVDFDLLNSYRIYDKMSFFNFSETVSNEDVQTIAESGPKPKRAKKVNSGMFSIFSVLTIFLRYRI